jgi:hypothetical protein
MAGSVYPEQDTDGSRRGRFPERKPSKEQRRGLARNPRRQAAGLAPGEPGQP